MVVTYRYVAKLEQTLVDTCKQCGVEAATSEEVGVWVDNRKIASIGERNSSIL